MFRETLLVLSLVSLTSGAVVVDRVAIIVGRRVVKSSDIDRDLRCSQFMNGEPLNVSPAAKQEVAERLITQELIRQEIMNGGYSQASEPDVNAFLLQTKKDRFKASETQFREALHRYALTDEQLRRYLRWQLTVLRFIDQRFRPGVLVTDEDVRTYYEEHRADLEKAYPQEKSFEALDPKIREIIAGERVNQALEEWLEQTRRRAFIERREAAFRDGDSSQGAAK